GEITEHPATGFHVASVHSIEVSTMLSSTKRESTTCRLRQPTMPVNLTSLSRQIRAPTSDKCRSQKLLKAQCFHPQILNGTLNHISSPERLSRICCPGRQLSWPNRTKLQRPPQA